MASLVSMACSIVLWRAILSPERERERKRERERERGREREKEREKRRRISSLRAFNKKEELFINNCYYEFA